MNRIILKSNIILEAKAIIEKHSSKDARHFAQSILDYFELDRKDILSSLTDSITDKELRGKIIPGYRVNI